MPVVEDILLELHAGFVDAMALRGHGLPLDVEGRGGDVGGWYGQGVCLVNQRTKLQCGPVVCIDSNSLSLSSIIVFSALHKLWGHVRLAQYIIHPEYRPKLCQLLVRQHRVEPVLQLVVLHTGGRLQVL